MIMVPLLASFHDAANGASRAASLNRRQSSSNCCCTSSTEGSNGWLPTSAWSRLRDHNTSCLRATEADSRGGAGMAVGYKASVPERRARVHTQRPETRRATQSQSAARRARTSVEVPRVACRRAARSACHCARAIFAWDIRILTANWRHHRRALRARKRATRAALRALAPIT